jgi:hypothetical protein
MIHLKGWGNLAVWLAAEFVRVRNSKVHDFGSIVGQVADLPSVCVAPSPKSHDFGYKKV